MKMFYRGLGKTIRVFNQVLSKMSWATKLKFSSTILQFNLAISYE